MHLNRNTIPIQNPPKLSPYADCKMCARLQISFVFLHILARETVCTSPVASLLAVGTSTAFSLVAPIGGDFALPKPHRQKGRACPFEPSLYPRDQPSADWIPPLHGDQSFRTLNHDKVSLQAPLDPMTKLTPFGLRQGLGDFTLHPATEP